MWRPGSINYCANDKILYGKIDVIKPCLDIISYEGSSVYEIEKSFQEAVEDYFDISKEQFDKKVYYQLNKYKWKEYYKSKVVREC